MPASFSRRDVLRTASVAAGGLLLARLPRTSRSAEQPASKDLIVHGQEPLNAEPALPHLAADDITPLAHFYVRCHGPIPKVEEEIFRVRVEGLVGKPLELSLAELKDKLRARTAAATLTCAGNRRKEISEIRQVSGVQWDAGAIGTATWTGALLSAVLEMAQLKPEAKHVWFEGLDPIKEKDGSVAPFGGSLPLARAMDKASPVLLAHSMNDQPLAAQHGFPLRTIVPGYIGARSVKWLTKIVVSDRPSPNHFVAEAYKLVQSEDKDELAKAEPIYQFPLNAAICAPAAGAKVKAGEVAIAGYALPPGDGKSTIAKVELSTDGGRSWKRAQVADGAAANCWQLWKLPLRLAPGKHQLVVRATDSAGRSQPEKGDWNLKGYLYNGWHRCEVEAA
jgi:sulfite oxidase